MLSNIGVYALSLYKYDEAEKFFIQASQLSSTSYNKDEFLPHLYLSYIYLISDKHPEAIRQYEKFLAIFPGERDKACDFTFDIFQENMNAFYRKYCYGPVLPEIL